MTCSNSSWHAARARLSRSAAAFLAGIGVALCTSSSSGAQQPPPSSALHPPIITLAQPPAGGNIPNDRATVFFRYGPGDASDPIDDASFQVWLDGVERTLGFRVGNGEAWGTLGAASAGQGNATGAPARPLVPGAHLVTARVCSVRGICASSNEVVVAVPTAALPDDDPSMLGQRRTARINKHNHWKQPQTLIGDLVSSVAKLFRH